MRKLFRYRNIIKTFSALFAVYLCIRYASQCADGIHKGLLFCIEVLVPSLFLLMALSSYLVKSGLLLWLTKPLSPISRLLFRLPSVSLAVILMSILGGYPVGARCAAILYEHGQLSESEAEKTACIAVCAGPGFLLNYVGRALLGNGGSGMVLLLSEIIGVLITGLIAGRTIKTIPLMINKVQKEQRSNLLISAVSDASKATFQLCGMVILCSALIEVIAVISPDAVVTDLASATVEITEGCHRMCGSYPLYLIAFFIGFGGISVHLQIYAGVGNLTLRKGLFFLYRIIQGIITAIATYILLMIFPIEQSVFNSTNDPLTAAKSATIFGSAALVLLSFCFVGSVHQKHIRR